MWTQQHQQVYDALYKAAEKIGTNNYNAGLYAVKRNRKGQVIQGYSITSEHEEVIRAMEDLESGAINPEQAMAILHKWDVFEQTYGVPPVPPLQKLPTRKTEAGTSKRGRVTQ